MKRRTFTKQGSSLGLAFLLGPFVNLSAKDRPWHHRSDLSPAMKAHLDFFSAEMNLGQFKSHQQQLIHAFVNPVRIGKVDIQSSSYRLEYKNIYQKTIVLTSKAGERRSQILS